jgi:hypothetical protein
MPAAIPARSMEGSHLADAAARSVYIVLVAVMIAIVLLGFWPFYSALLSGGTGAHWIVYVHAAVFSGWMVLLATQVVLVHRRRLGTHQRLGRVGIPYGLLVLVLGLAVTIAAPVQHVIAGRSTLDEAAGFLILPLGDMLLFGGFFAAGLHFRRRKELHKRLMILATIALLFAPAARIGGDVGPWAILAVWLLPLALAMIHDALVRRRVERVYLIGAAILLVAFARIGLMESELWLVVGRRLLSPWLPVGTE